MPRKIRELIADVERASWHIEPGGREAIGSLLIRVHKRKIILSGASGADAHHYQEKLVKSAIREVQP